MDDYLLQINNTFFDV